VISPLEYPTRTLATALSEDQLLAGRSVEHLIGTKCRDSLYRFNLAVQCVGNEQTDCAHAGPVESICNHKVGISTIISPAFKNSFHCAVLVPFSRRHQPHTEYLLALEGMKSCSKSSLIVWCATFEFLGVEEFVLLALRVMKGLFDN
jgi:hypothetical protein